MRIENIKQQSFHPSKKMGQNFLNNEKVISNIVENIPPLDKYDLILEIGPGLGAITDYLIAFNKPVIAVELDKRLNEYITNKFKDDKNFKVVNDDFLTLDLDKLLKEFNNVIVVANIPYSITKPIIMKCLKNTKIQTLYIMVQKEVADKLDYSKNSNHNAFTNIINFYFQYKKMFNIDKACFKPQPQVHSAMILIDKKKNLKYDQAFFDFLTKLFQAKRKKLLNNIVNIDFKNKLIDVFNKLNIDLSIRAEQLSYEQLYEMYLLLR